MPDDPLNDPVYLDFLKRLVDAKGPVAIKQQGPGAYFQDRCQLGQQDPDAPDPGAYFQPAPPRTMRDPLPVTQEQRVDEATERQIAPFLDDSLARNHIKLVDILSAEYNELIKDAEERARRKLAEPIAPYDLVGRYPAPHKRRRVKSVEPIAPDDPRLTHDLHDVPYTTTEWAVPPGRTTHAVIMDAGKRYLARTRRVRLEVDVVPEPDPALVRKMKGNSRVLLVYLWKKTDNTTLDDLRDALHEAKPNSPLPKDKAVTKAVERLENAMHKAGLVTTRIVKNGGMIYLSHPQKP